MLEIRDPHVDDLIQRLCDPLSTERPAPSSPQKYLTESEASGRVDWDSYFFEIARVVSTRATCPRAAIGVVLVDKRHRLLATGYNGAAAGEAHCVDTGCTLYADHCVRAKHAERNAVEAVWEVMGHPSFAGFLLKFDVTPYVYGPRPICSECAATMYRAGIRREPKRSDA